MSLKDTLYTLVKAVIGAETVIFADQNSPRPAIPYWTLRVSMGRALGVDYFSQGVTAQGDQTIAGVREATLQVQRIGANSDTACADLRDNLSKTTVMEAWRLQKIALYDTGDVQNIPFKLDNSQLEPRASVDLFVRFGTELLDRVGAVETVTIDAAYRTLESDNPDLADTITVVL